MVPNCSSRVSTGTRLALLFILISLVISAGGVQTINLSAEAVSESQIRLSCRINHPGAFSTIRTSGMPGAVLVVNSVIRDFPDNCAIPQSEVALGEAME
jgi:hypothetical protein